MTFLLSGLVVGYKTLHTMELTTLTQPTENKVIVNELREITKRNQLISFVAVVFGVVKACDS